MKLSQRFIGLLLSVLMSGVPAIWAQTQAQAPQSENATKPSDLPDSPSYSQAQAQKTTLAQATQPQEPQAPQSQPDSQPAASQPPQPQPDSQPATSQPPQSQPAESQSTASQQTQTPATNSQPAQQETQSSQPGDQNPAGAATAQRGKTAGGAASRPAGAALAPAKQRNPRSLLIKLGLLAGAGVALGTAFALSQASPSRPPGAH